MRSAMQHAVGEERVTGLDRGVTPRNYTPRAGRVARRRPAGRPASRSVGRPCGRTRSRASGIAHNNVTMSRTGDSPAREIAVARHIGRDGARRHAAPLAHLSPLFRPVDVHPARLPRATCLPQRVPSPERVQDPRFEYFVRKIFDRETKSRFPFEILSLRSLADSPMGSHFVALRRNSIVFLVITVVIIVIS